MTTSLLLTLVTLAAISLLLTPRQRTVEGFYAGRDAQGEGPSMITLVFSQVTTWIFARSLLTAAILGFYYGIGGALAYTAYYLSFFTGAVIVDQIRFRHGFNSVQAFLTDRFGPSGTSAYNVVVGLRLLSEVFANLIVVGTLFGAEGSSLYLVAASVAALFTLGYSMAGGLQSSLRTDVFQMSVFLVMLAVLVFSLAGAPGWSLSVIPATAKPVSDPGWILLMVAMLQVISYPMHDPVMMDRGFLADRKTTWKSFLHAGWLSMGCIFLFALLGVYAGTVKLPDEAMMDVLRRTLGDTTMMVLNVALIVSAVSTLEFHPVQRLQTCDQGHGAGQANLDERAACHACLHGRWARLPVPRYQGALCCRGDLGHGIDVPDAGHPVLHHRRPARQPVGIPRGLRCRCVRRCSLLPRNQ